MKIGKSGLKRFYNTLKISICLGLVVFAARYNMSGTNSIISYAEDYVDVFYEGVVDNRVNVRVAPGQENDQVMHNGKEVKLQAGDKVMIIGEELVGDKVWYHVRFTLDGEEIDGYSTSTYITKTSETTIPSPVPTSSTTITPTLLPDSSLPMTDGFYVGIVNDSVNVRIAPGKKSAQVMYKGEGVKLRAGDKVTIIGEEMVGHNIWYHIRFTLDDKEIVGYSSGAYITKTNTIAKLSEKSENSGSSIWVWIVSIGFELLIILRFFKRCVFD